jgi:frataxin-like iron-binding protein CyaY
MRNRMAILAGAVTVGLLITGIAFAAQDVDESTVNVSLADSQTLTLPVDNAGVIVLNRANDQLRIVSATPNTGYTAEVEVAVGREVEADFFGDGLRVRFNGELEDGVVRVRIRTEADDNNGLTSTSVTSVSGTSVTGPTSPTSTSPTALPSSTAAGNGSGNLVLAEGQVSQVPVADAGSVVLRRSGGSLAIISTETNPGWVVEVEVATGREVEGDFRSGSRRVKFNFELEDGVVRVRIESEGSSSGGSTTTSTTIGSGSSTSTTNAAGAGSTLPTGAVTYNLGGAGTVSVIFASGGMTIGSINPAAGWTIEDSEQKSDEIDIELTNGDGEAELRLKINNGVLEVEIDNKTS